MSRQPSGIIQTILLQGDALEQLTDKEAASRLSLRPLGIPIIVERLSDTSEFYQINSPLDVYANEIPRGTVAYVAGAYLRQQNPSAPSDSRSKRFTYWIAVQFYQKK